VSKYRLSPLLNNAAIHGGDEVAVARKRRDEKESGLAGAERAPRRHVIAMTSLTSMTTCDV